MSAEVSKQVNDARELVEISIKEMQKVSAAADGIQEWIIEPIRKLTAKGTRVAVIFGIGGIIAGVLTSVVGGLLLGPINELRNKPTTPQSQAIVKSPSEPSFLTNSDKDSLFGSTPQLEEIKKMLADKILEPTPTRDEAKK